MKTLLSAELDKIKSQNLYRQLKVISSSPDKEAVINGEKYLNFSSNNYLGLANHPKTKQAAIKAIKKYGCGGTSSRLISGTLDIHNELELKLAELKGKQAALVYPSGFQANQGIISSLLSEGDCLIMDKLNHASLWDASKISRARVFVYEHLDMESLEKVLKRAKDYKKRLIVTDSIFSMDGDLAPLKDIVLLKDKYKAWLMIDEAHATGVFGARGSGLAEHFGVEDKIEIVMGTLSKALGSQGGFVCGPKELIEYLINRSRSFIYTTALSPASAAGAIEALNIIKQEPQRRIKLLDNARKLREKLKSMGFNTFNSESQIIPVLSGTVEKTLELSLKLNSKNIIVPAVRPPTVPDGSARLRISLTSSHTLQDLDKLTEAIG